MAAVGEVVECPATGRTVRVDIFKNGGEFEVSCRQGGRYVGAIVRTSARAAASAAWAWVAGVPGAPRPRA